MIKIRIKKTIFVFLAVLFFTITVSASSKSWYFRKNKAHNQPELPNDLKIVEKYDGFWCDKKHIKIDDEEKVIYLTFDVGYENGNVKKILDVLNEENVKGNFFILSNLILKNKDLVQRMIDEGHCLGNHTSKHKDMTKMKTKEEFKFELEKLEKIFSENFGVNLAKYYRPPEGKFNEQNMIWAKELGYKTVFWSYAYQDWDNNNQMNEEKAIEKILENIHNGEVILFHPTSSTNAQIMRRLIIELKNQGFRFGVLDELCSN